MDPDFELIDGEALYHRVIRDTVLNAKSSVWLATANVKDCQIELRGRFTSIVNAFDALCRQGVEIRLLHAGVPSASFLDSLRGSPLLQRPGFKMRRCQRVHFKAVLVDDRSLYIGSANLTGAGLGAKSGARRNFELGLLTQQPGLLDCVAEIYHRIWEGLECGACGRRDLCPVPLEEPDF